jgi:hypothetical protein
MEVDAFGTSLRCSPSVSPHDGRYNLAFQLAIERESRRTCEDSANWSGLLPAAVVRVDLTHRSATVRDDASPYNSAPCAATGPPTGSRTDESSLAGLLTLVETGTASSHSEGHGFRSACAPGRPGSSQAP